MTAAVESIATLHSILPMMLTAGDTKQDLFNDLILNKACLYFPQQAICLAQQLKCSKKYITNILDAIMAIDPSIGIVNLIEATIAEFHQQCRHRVNCLPYLFEAVELAQLPDAPGCISGSRHM
ncbi:hypothetical protein JVT61DRAFT_5872 [Boletus reticuloceps]|uniref:Uncharacterized protein n=1 Tax=Boletus reticuloceps TaxID=495285 RepID=A0A8I2YM22_9AGAM|nr:hypothetical protein JVT61DRAFT_5872 [Boletus reticuloceps]